VNNYPYEKQLKGKSSVFINVLGEKNILADILPESLRDYSIKINVKDFGVVNLYYKPTQNTYSIALHEIRNEGNKLIIQNYWDELHGIAPEETYKNKGYEIDVDGSYRNGVTSYGAVIRKEGKKIEELSGIVKTALVKGSHQIAGEIKAVTESVKWCIENKVREVTIYYDYKGLEKWAVGEWKTKKMISQQYSDFMKSNNVKIRWVKIQSHTGKVWNEYADKLAAKAISYGKKN
jgi:ribonuclease H-related protein